MDTAADLTCSEQTRDNFTIGAEHLSGGVDGQTAHRVMQGRLARGSEEGTVVDLFIQRVLLEVSIDTGINVAVVLLNGSQERSLGIAFKAELVSQFVKGIIPFLALHCLLHSPYSATNRNRCRLYIRRTVSSILKGIHPETYLMFQYNPEEFINMVIFFWYRNQPCSFHSSQRDDHLMHLSIAEIREEIPLQQKIIHGYGGRSIFQVIRIVNDDMIISLPEATDHIRMIPG